MSRKKRRIGIALVLLLLLIVSPFWNTYREYRQARLDHALIEAIKAGNDQRALEALAEGASGEARDTGEPPTFREALLHLWDRIRHPGKDAAAQYPPALLLLYRTDFDSKQLNYSLTPGPDLRVILPLLDHGPGPDMALVRALLDHGAQVNNLDTGVDNWGAYNRSPLLYASGFSNCDTVRLLLARGADMEAKDNNGFTPLIYADSGITRVLVEHGANIEARSWRNRTPLIWAAIRDNPDVVRILLEHGAKGEAKDVNGKTALDYVRDSDYPQRRQIVALLRQYGAK